ncbi:procyclin-associated gene 1 (PAG1) polypeptide, putative [Trypanosoma brucei brucei TREU927]|uniref:Procyclin-associated gene 1 (PAG1) polypeptide, putative n=1 Tax=Trypanosoma brucei brucei (strain 927/4 GUTat10.1) TaxID=185431 RepID=Q389V4_TRYB2|nr:procyclin-associated gene 1 polypeptide [Trypanosoma brucei brucei TREU927]EAN78416.1 procyclin-associated gene 1 (PAG1) polypeptide, putative [Trypanosoma brucei brucei TREU927]
MRRTVAFLVVALVSGCCHHADAGAALKLSAIKALCNTSKKLKAVHGFVEQKLMEADRKLEEVQLLQKVVRLKLLTEWNKGLKCGTLRVFLTQVRINEQNMVREVDELWDVGRRLVGEAGIAAGRLDEMVSVFVQAHRDANNSCIGGLSVNFPEEVLPSCYAKNKDSGEWESLKITEGENLFENPFEMNLESVLHDSLLVDGGDPRHDFGKDLGCQLTVGKAGGGYMGNGDLSENIIWGDGVLGVVKSGSQMTGFKGNTRATTYDTAVVWEENPTGGNPTLVKVVKDYKLFAELERKVDASHKHLVDRFVQENLYVEDLGTLGRKANSAVDKNTEGEDDEEEKSMEDWVAQVDGERVEDRLLGEELKDCGV